MQKEFSYLIKLEGVGCSRKQKGRKKTAYNTQHCKLKLAINTAAAFCFFKNSFALWLVQKISIVTTAFLSTNQMQNTNLSYGRHYFSFDFTIFETDSTNIKTHWDCFTLCQASQIIEITTTAAGISCMCN